MPEIERGDGQLAYPCPHCQIMLEPPEEPWQGWVRCPRCGRPGLPPEGLRHALLRKRKTTSGDRLEPQTDGQSQSALASAPANAQGTGSSPRSRPGRRDRPLMGCVRVLPRAPGA